MLADIDNSQCELAITSLECTFTKELKFKSEDGHEANIKKIIQTRSFPGCAAKASALNENRRQVNI